VETAASADITTPLFQGLTENTVLDAMTAIRTGGIPPQTTGTALGTMIELGAADRGILVNAIELHKRSVAEWWLQLVEEWGAVMPGQQERGVLSVPSRDAAYGGTPMHTITPEVIERGGRYLSFKLHRFKADPALSQFLLSLRSPGPTGEPVISDETIRRKLYVVPDPDREADRVQNQMIYANPAIATQRAIRRIDLEASRELKAGDVANADALMAAGIELDYVRQQQIMAGAAAPPEAAAPPAMAGAEVAPPEPPPPSNGQPPITQQGMSMPEMGKPVGTSGGRPTGSGEPTQPTPPTPVTPRAR
jgi:hypothetical protein